MKLAILSLLLFANTATFSAPNDEAYFRQFLYHWVDLNKDPDFPPKLRYYSIWNDFGYEIPIDKTHNLKIMFELYLNADGTWDNSYTDFIETVGDPNWKIRKCVVEHGRWAVPDKELELYDAQGFRIAIGSRTVVFGQNAVKFRWTADFPTTEMRGGMRDFVTTQSEWPKTTSCFP